MKSGKYPDPMADKYLECGDCETRMPVGSRARWRCLLLPPDERSGPGFPSPPKWGHTREDPCPGGLIRLPQVMEASRAHFWMEKGQLGERYPEQSPLMHDCIDELAAASNAAEQDLLKAGG